MRTMLALSALSALSFVAMSSAPPGGRTMSIAIALRDDEPPTEFRIFKAGRNDSDQGPVMFDDVAAESVMQAYKLHGVRPIVDLEHKSTLDPRTDVHYDPDARGDFDLELRNGELWAVNVRWADDGVRRLKSKTQRFFSPFFLQLDKGDGSIPRVFRLVNVGLVAQPALDHCPALVAESTPLARRSTVAKPAPAISAMAFDSSGTGAIAPEDLPQIAEAFHLDAGASVADIIQAAMAFVKEFDVGEPPPADGGDNPLGPPAGGGDPAAMRRKFAEQLVARVAKVASSSRKALPAEAQLKAFRSLIVRETNATTTEEALETIRGWRDDSRALSSERAKIAKERELVEAKDRHDLTVEIVKLGVFTPAQAWESDKEGIPQAPDATKGIDGKPSVLMRRFSLAELREVRDKSQKPGGKSQLPGGGAPGAAPATPPAQNGTVVEVTLSGGVKKNVELSEREVNLAKKRLGARAKDENAVRESLVKYATLKARSATKADVQPVKVG